METETLHLRVTQASLNQTALDYPRNIANIIAAIDEAVARKSDILALEELTLTGYEVNDDFQRTDNKRILAGLDDIAAYAKALDPNLIVSIGHPWRLQMRDVKGPEGAEYEKVKSPLYDRLNLPFNMQTIISGGAILGMTAKTNLYNDGRGYEKRYFNEWSVEAANKAGGIFGTIMVPLDPEGKRIVPVGAPIIYVKGKDEKGFYLSQAICETKWVATKYDGYPHNDSRYDRDNMIPAISRYLGGKQGSVLLIPNASPPAPNKIDKHIHLDKLAGQYFDVVVDTDGLGTSGATFAQTGHRVIVKDGEVISYGSRMNFDRVATTTTSFEIESLPENRLGKEHTVVSHDFRSWNDTKTKNLIWEQDPAQAWDDPSNPDRHYEEVVRNTALWLFDYMRKTGAKSTMEALSGGADSAYNSVIVSAMVHLGIHELGAKEFCKEIRLPNADRIIAAQKEGGIPAAVAECMDEMLACDYLGTSNNATSSLKAAEYLMQGGPDLESGETIPGIGGEFEARNIQELFDFLAVTYAVPDTTKIPPDQKQKFLIDFGAYFNANPNILSEDEIEKMGQDLKEKYPFVKHLITASNGTVYENAQARLRMVLSRMRAEMKRKLPIANPNLDEIRNGYTTVGGDQHSGNVGINSHIGKNHELKIMKYLYQYGLRGVMPPVRALGKVLGETPTAGLMPLGANGEQVQTDEDSLQRSYPQMNRISEEQLGKRIDEINGSRRLNANEIFDACKKEELFQSVDDNSLYNMLRKSFNRWAVAQHKVHMGVIGPTFDDSVDHQTSLRTPNLSGESKDELTTLGIRLLFNWAKRDGVDWDDNTRAVLDKRAEVDEGFITEFTKSVLVHKPGQDYDLETLYGRIKEVGWHGAFTPLPQGHFITTILKQRTLEAA